MNDHSIPWTTSRNVEDIYATVAGDINVRSAEQNLRVELMKLSTRFQAIADGIEAVLLDNDPGALARMYDLAQHAADGLAACRVVRARLNSLAQHPPIEQAY